VDPEQTEGELMKMKNQTGAAAQLDRFHAMFDLLNEPGRVDLLISAIGCSRLGNWDGCVCSQFSIRNVDVEIACGKGSKPQGVRVSSTHGDYTDRAMLEMIADTIVEQLEASCSRSGPWPVTLSLGD
jgi:hypothetical protein